MKEKINIAEILKDKKEGIRLYSPIFGECAFCYVREDTNDICVKKHNGVIEYFNSEGLYFALGEVMLFPSKEMRDWSKFAWKKGDILVNKDAQVHIIFDGFEDDTYKNFNGKYYIWEELGSIVSFEEEENYMQTSDFNKANKEYAQEYIHKIEKELGCKLNMETLEIEKQLEFKDGDIVVYKCEIDDVPSTIFIFRGISQRTPYYSYYASLNSDGFLSYKLGGFGIYKRELRLATEEEKEQLFSALEKEGKAWDSEKKKVVNLKPKFDELKPFDKVVVRCSEADRWSIDFFSYKVHNGYICAGDAWFGYCLPYNDETAYLLGTTDEWKGGER